MRIRIGFAGALAMAVAASALAQGDRWQELVNRGSAAEIAGDYAGAAASYREASQVAEAFDRADPRRVYAWNAEGMMYDAMGRFAESDTAYRRALAALDLAQGPPTINRAVLLANMANVAMEMGQRARAEKLLRESIDIHTRIASPDELRLSIARNSLADLLTISGRYAEAVPIIESTLPILERDPKAATEFGSSLNNLGAVRLYQGRYIEAQQLLERSLATLEAARGPAHPILLRTLHNLAAARERNGRQAAAGETWRRAVDLAAASLGLEHPLYGEILGSYAAWLRASGDKAGSKTLAARSAEILRQHRRRNGVDGVVDVTSLRQ